MRRLLGMLFVATCALLMIIPAEQAMPQGAKAAIEKSGVMRIVAGIAPQVLGYPPDMGPQDFTYAYPGMEPLMQYSDRRTLEPFLCTKVDINPAKKTITFHLRKGIKFHDGTELTAEVARWNYQLLMDAKKLQYAEKIKSIDLLDPYTFRLNLSEYNNQLIHSFGYMFMSSRKSIEERGKDWARVNCVGTGPFQQLEFKRDEYLYWTRFANYWQKDKGFPYLDRVEVRFIPDPVTASSIIETKQADLWMGPTSQYQRVMVQKGFVRQAGYAGLNMWIMPNYFRADGKWKNKKLREALEYAIDKAAITKALGFGYTVPMNLVCASGEWGYDSSLRRDYNPARSRRLIKEAGYSSPVKVNLQVESNGRNIGSAIKGYLDTAGFECDLDVADSGRYFTSTYGSGWDDLCLASTAVDANYLVTIGRWFSPQPKTKLAGWNCPKELADLYHQAIAKNTDQEQELMTRKIVKYIFDEALICPVYFLPLAGIMQPYVHTDYMRQGVYRWKFAEDWMERH